MLPSSGRSGWIHAGSKSCTSFANAFHTACSKPLPFVPLPPSFPFPLLPFVSPFPFASPLSVGDTYDPKGPSSRFTKSAGGSSKVLRSFLDACPSWSSFSPGPEMLTCPFNSFFKSVHVQLRLPSLSFREPDPSQKCLHGGITFDCKMAYSIRRKGQPSSMSVEGAMFTPSASGRKGKQHVGCSCNRCSAYLKSHCTPTFDAHFHPSCRRSASFCLSSYDPYALRIRLPGSAAVASLVSGSCQHPPPYRQVCAAFAFLSRDMRPLACISQFWH